ncbi:GAF domain-containing protein [Candidatus Bipolaricaulota bacterium]|nr:GAF domain-containing protein [Candidatus Bipolaricaulota bacterium]
MDTMKEGLFEAIRTAVSFAEACQRTVIWLRVNWPHFDWVGIYLREGEELVLTAWDGPEATQHMRIPVGQGICGLAARTGETVVVDDVNADDRYLACFPQTRAEIVVPLLLGQEVIGEIDIDSDTRAAFTQADRDLIKETASVLTAVLSQVIE